MRLPSAAELDNIANTQLDAMDDLCNIYSVSMSSGTYGNNTEVRTVVATGVPCGIQFTGGKIVQRGETFFVDYDALLRIVDGRTILMTYEIDLIEKGEFVISGTFKPYSMPTVNSSVQKVPLKRQTP